MKFYSKMNNNRRIWPIYFPIFLFKVESHRFIKVSTLLSRTYFRTVKVFWNSNKPTESPLSAFQVGIFFFNTISNINLPFLFREVWKLPTVLIKT